MQRFLPLLLSTLAILVSANSVSAQGAAREDRASVQNLEQYTAGNSPDGLPRSVDLRPWLPEVGLQTMNDCAAWAFGYAGRSYLEAIDQGWKPDAAERIFSPTFIYNQVNQGVDQGSRIDRVLDLLMKQGAATLATAPYLAKDHLTQPPQLARSEADRFRIADYGVLPDGTWIRQALAEGHIVMCCVRTNPVFSSGRYPVYTPELHAKGQATRRPDQPHGFHAMAIVGYNDEREAFLFMNSWGKDWGEGGFVWVGYEVLQQFNADGVEDRLMDFAVVMFDRREPIARVDGAYTVLPLEQLQMTGFGTYSGYDEAAAEGEYRYHLMIRGEQKLMERVKEVIWTVPGPDGIREVVAQETEKGFRVNFRSDSADIEVKAVATLDSGHQATLTGGLQVPVAQRRQLSLKRVDSFHESTTEGDLWRWTLLPSLSDTDWRDLRSISYEFDNSSIASPPAYEHDGGLPPVWSFESTAMPSFWTAEPVAGRAVLYFVDGTEHELSFAAEPFTDPVRKELGREIVWRPVGVDGDRHWYFYELQIRYPEAWADNLLGIRIGTGNLVDWSSHEAQAVPGPGPLMHVFHGYARRPFASGATAWFRQTHPSLGNTTPVTSHDIHAFGDECAWVIPEFEDETLLVAGRGYGIESEDRYLGEIDGVPTWETRVYLDGTANLMAVNQVVWTTPDGEFDFQRDDETTSGPLEGYMLVRRNSEAFPVRARATMWNGESFELERQIQNYAPRNDALGMDLVDQTPHELLAAAPDRALVSVRLAGPQEHLHGLREIIAYAPRAWGGVLPTQVAAFSFNEEPEVGVELARLEVPRDERVLFVLHYHDGSSLSLRALPHAIATLPVQPRLQILARETFLGWRDELPQWSADLELRGDYELLSQVEEVTWEWEAIQPEVLGAVHAMPDAQRSGFAQVTGPSRVRARLTFAEESGIEAQTVEADLLTLSYRGQGDARVLVEMGTAPSLLELYGPNVDIWSVSEPATPYRFRITASREVLAKIAQVEWIVRDPWAEEYAAENGESAPEPERHLRGPETRDSGFAWDTSKHPDESDFAVTVRLQDVDGEVVELSSFTWDYELETEQVRRAIAATEVRDWGEVDGQRAALLIAGVPLGNHSEGLLRAEFESDTALQPIAGLPAAALERPVSRRAFLAQTAGELKTVQLRLREEDDMGFEEKELRLRGAGGFALPPAIASPVLECEQSDEGAGSFWYVWLRAPESLLAQADRAVWTVWKDGEQRDFVIDDRVGERSDGFELRWAGAGPQRLELRLERNGEVVPGAVFARELP